MNKDRLMISNIRDGLEIADDLFLYLLKKDEICDKRKISKRSYDYQLKRIKTFIDEKTSPNIEDYKNKNFLFYNISTKKIKIDFFNFFYEFNNYMEINSQVDKGYYFENFFEPNFKMDEKTYNTYLNKMVFCGYIYIENNKIYKTENLLDDMSEEQIRRLRYLIRYACYNLYPALPFVYLQNTLQIYHYQKFSKNIRIPIIFTGEFYTSILYEEIMYMIIDSIKNKENIKIFLKKNYDKTTKEHILKPLQIRIDIKTHRLYLVALLKNKNQICIFKIENIKKVEKIKEEEVYTYNNYKYKLKKFRFSSKFNNKISITVQFNIEKEDEHLLSKIYQSMFGDNLIKVKNNTYESTIKIYDYIELKPFLRSMGEHVKIKKSDNIELKNSLLSEYKEMLEKYGAFF